MPRLHPDGSAFHVLTMKPAQRALLSICLGVTALTCRLPAPNPSPTSSIPPLGTRPYQLTTPCSPTRDSARSFCLFENTTSKHHLFRMKDWQSRKALSGVTYRKECAKADDTNLDDSSPRPRNRQFRKALSGVTHRSESTKADDTSSNGKVVPKRE